MTRLLLALFNLLLTALMVLLIAFVLTGAWLQTPFGRDWISQKASHLASEATGYTLSAEGLSAGWPFSIDLEKLDIADSQGPFLQLDGLSLNWNPLALLDHALKIDSLTAENILLRRVPLAPATPAPTPLQTESNGATTPSPEISLDVGSLRIHRLVLAESLTELTELTLGVEAFALSGSESQLEGQIHLTAAPSELWPDTTEANLHLTASRSGVTLQDVNLASFGATLTGAASFSDNVVQAAFALTAPDLSSQTPLSGALDGHITLAGTHDQLHADVSVQVPHALLDGQDLGALSTSFQLLKNPDATCLQNLKLALPATTGQGDLCLKNATNNLQGTATLTIGKLETLARLIPGLPALSGQAQLKLAPDTANQLSWALTHRGHVAGYATTLETSGTASTRSLKIARLLGSINTTPFRLLRPTSIEKTDKKITFAQTQLSLGKSLWQAKVDQNEKMLSGQIAFQHVDLPLLGLLDADLLALNMAGDLSGKINLSGKADSPKIEATATLKDGSYTDPTTGLSLQKITAQAQLKDHLLSLASIAGTDGKEGTFKGAGTLKIGPQDSLPIQISATFQKMRTLRLESAKATTSGDLTLSGDLTSALALNGTIRVEDAFFAIPKRLPLSLVNLPVTEVGGPSRQPRPLRNTTAAVSRQTLLPIALDLLLSAPNRVRVEGRGLTSELQGTLHLKGTADTPDIQGQLGIVRGTYDFLGKTLALSQGYIRFDRGTLTDPSLELDATQTAAALTTTVHVRGAASAPVITFDSSPALPQDEIIAQMLFGHGMSQLTPVESVQLAAALASLVSDTDTPDIKGKIRRTLGLDTLDITSTSTTTSTTTGTTTSAQSDTQTSAVKAGKYITDKVFLHVQQGLTPQSQAAGLEVRVTPSISLESSVGAGAQTDLSVKLQRDY